MAWSTVKGLELGIYFPLPIFSCAIVKFFELIDLGSMYVSRFVWYSMIESTIEYKFVIQISRIFTYSYYVAINKLQDFQNGYTILN